ncbi:MAG: hypothetical protein ABFC78_04755 [Methanoregula sp.]
MGELLNRENFILQMAEKQDLINDEIYQNVEPFTGVTDFSDIKLHQRFDMIMSPLAIGTFSIGRIKIRVVKIPVSQVHTDLFSSTVFVKEFEFFLKSVMH